MWAVDDEGIVYQRIGVKAPTSHSLPSAWLPVDSGPTGTTFIQVHAGPSDHLVSTFCIFHLFLSIELSDHLLAVLLEL